MGYDQNNNTKSGLPRKPDGGIDTKAFMDEYQKRLDPVKRRLQWYHSRDKSQGWDILLSTIEKYPDPKNSHKIMAALHQRAMETGTNSDLAKKIYKVLWLFGYPEMFNYEYLKNVGKKNDPVSPTGAEDGN